MSLTFVGRFPPMFTDKAKYERDGIGFSTYEGDKRIYGEMGYGLYGFDVEGQDHIASFLPSGPRLPYDFPDFEIVSCEDKSEEEPEGPTTLKGSSWEPDFGTHQLKYKGVLIQEFTTSGVSMLKCMGKMYAVALRAGGGADIFLFNTTA